MGRDINHTEIVLAAPAFVKQILHFCRILRKGEDGGSIRKAPFFIEVFKMEVKFGRPPPRINQRQMKPAGLIGISGVREYFPKRDGPNP